MEPESVQPEPPPAPPAPAEIAAAAWTPGRIHHLGPFEVPGLRARAVRVYLPRGYSPATPHRALYLFDGQNVFDDAPSFAGGWHAHETVEGLARRHPAPVVIAIDHGGESRITELSPFPVEGQDGQLDLLLDWIAGALMPRFAAELALLPGPLGTVIGGSSMGGLAALYAHFARPGEFGGALVMSPSFWLGDGEILRWVAARPIPEVSRLYLDCGTREGRGTLLPLMTAMASLLSSRGYDCDRLLFRPDIRGAHNERSWRRRLPKALRFFYG